MEEQRQDEQLYIKGFNNGYLLAKHEPELATQLTAKTNDHSDYFKGLTGGREQYEKEAREWAKSFSRSAPSKDDREKDLER